MIDWTRFEENQNEILKELYHQMFIVAYSKMNNKADALDIVQESWIKILQNIDGLKDSKKLLQWAKAIVSNTACTMLRKRYHQAALFFDREIVSQQEESVAFEVEKRFLRRMVTESLSQLDEETRKMFVFKYYYGWRDKDISNVLDLPLGTVKARIHRAKCRLRKIISYT